MLEDEAAFSLILAQDCLDIKVKMMGKCTVTIKTEIYTHSQFVQILMDNLDEFLNENIVILETNSMQSSMNTFIFYYKKMKGVSITCFTKSFLKAKKITLLIFLKKKCEGKKFHCTLFFRGPTRRDMSL